MLKIKEIQSDKAKMNITLEDGKQFTGYVLKMDVRNNLMNFLQDGTIEAVQFPLNNVIQIEVIQENLQ